MNLKNSNNEKKKSERREIDRIMRLVNDLCFKCHESDDWTPLDDLLKEVDVDATLNVHLLTWLITSGWARQHLLYRDTFYKKVEEKLKDHPRKDGMLKGLR